MIFCYSCKKVNGNESSNFLHTGKQNGILYDRMSSVQYSGTLHSITNVLYMLLSNFQGDASFPGHWDGMTAQKHCQVFPLKNDSQEYLDVQKHFRASCHNAILKVCILLYKSHFNGSCLQFQNLNCKAFSHICTEMFVKV